MAAVRSTEELSVVCLDMEVPEDVTSEGGWRCLRVKGPLEFSLVGIIAGLASCLAAAGVSLFVISTFDTDYFLVQDARLALALKALEKEGYAVESIAANREPIALD